MFTCYKLHYLIFNSKLLLLNHYVILIFVFPAQINGTYRILGGQDAKTGELLKSYKKTGHNQFQISILL